MGKNLYEEADGIDNFNVKSQLDIKYNYEIVIYN
jgi:hypothetical protein